MSTIRNFGVFFTLASSMCISTPTNAQSVLGLIGGGDSGALITIENGDAGNSGLVNLGLGGGDGNVVDANVGNAVGANVSVGGGGSGSGGSSGGGVGVNLNVGGGDSSGNGGSGVGVNLSIGGGGSGSGGGTGNGGGGGGGGSVNALGSNGGGGGVNAVTSGGGGAGGNRSGAAAVAALGNGVSATCTGTDPSQAWQLFERTSLSGWNRASNIEIVLVQLCPEDRQRLSRILRNETKFNQMQSTARSDVLVAAALGRGNFNFDRLLGVKQSGSRLIVYVY